MKFCSQCGSIVSHTIPNGDNIPRYVCNQCETIHYQNPKIITGTIPEWNDKILLCKRAIEPRHGLWTLPAGFMENSETTIEGALRESMEEAHAQLNNLSLFCVFSIPHISQVYMIYRGELIDGKARPGSETLSLDLFSEADIPWDELAFPVINETLKLYFKDKAAGRFLTHSGDIIRSNDQIIVSHY
ncbi:MAG: NUDIX hydrolase [Gammaproteobacteria bacterium]|nr:NUDIX hydrolase [Gammaproteobacteria bacterium]MCW8910314.1 NUDIX hydrolase [Gammaproteobacteria bacterium]MCW9004435.1 NUDIX hydrolase [Gammaproteobacteria bacterium]MCW9055131.1 NUDIX hydrolase [Gammaproteobacteria bacterium]